MKRSANFLIKGLLVIVLFTTGSVALSTAGVKTVSEANAAVSQQQVVAYLTARGYQVISMNPYKGTQDWYGHTVLNGINYTTHVFVSGDQIIDSQDVAM